MMCFTIYGGMINHRHILREAPLIRDFVAVHGFSMISTPGVRHHIEQLKLKIHRPLKQTETTLSYSANYKKKLYFLWRCFVWWSSVCLGCLCASVTKLHVFLFCFKISKALKISENFSNYNMLSKNDLTAHIGTSLHSSWHFGYFIVRIDLKCAVCHSKNEIQVMWRPFQYIRPCEVIESIHWMLQFNGGEKMKKNSMKTKCTNESTI